MLGIKLHQEVRRHVFISSISLLTRLSLIIIIPVDHVVSLNDVKELCGCEVAVHRNEASLLRTGIYVIPPETNPLARGISWLGNNLLCNSDHRIR